MKTLLLTTDEEKKATKLSPIALELLSFLRENNGYALASSHSIDGNALNELLACQLIETTLFGVKLSGCGIVRTPGFDPRGDGFTVHYYRVVNIHDNAAIQRLRGWSEQGLLEYFIAHQEWGSKEKAILKTKEECTTIITTLPAPRLSRAFQEGDLIQTRTPRVAATIVVAPDNPEAAPDGTMLVNPQEIIMTGVVRDVQDGGYGWMNVEWDETLYANPTVFIADADMFRKVSKKNFGNLWTSMV